jgi:hypothetical protein
MLNTTSEDPATAPGESAHFAPLATSGRAFSFEREYTVTPYPFARMCPHIDNPITPVPIHPMRVVSGDMSFIFAASLA